MVLYTNAHHNFQISFYKTCCQPSIHFFKSSLHLLCWSYQIEIPLLDVVMRQTETKFGTFTIKAKGMIYFFSNKLRMCLCSLRIWIRPATPSTDTAPTRPWSPAHIFTRQTSLWSRHLRRTFWRHRNLQRRNVCLQGELIGKTCHFDFVFYLLLVYSKAVSLFETLGKLVLAST